MKIKRIFEFVPVPVEQRLTKQAIFAEVEKRGEISRTITSVIRSGEFQIDTTGKVPRGAEFRVGIFEAKAIGAQGYSTERFFASEALPENFGRHWLSRCDDYDVIDYFLNHASENSLVTSSIGHSILVASIPVHHNPYLYVPMVSFEAGTRGSYLECQHLSGQIISGNDLIALRFLVPLAK